MRGKQRCSGKVKELFLEKDSFETILFRAEKDTIDKKSSESPGSPDTIFSPLIESPVPMKPLPAALGAATKKKVAPTKDSAPEPVLPVTAVWGGGRKVWTSPREQEILDEHLDGEALASRSKLPVKPADRGRPERRERRAQRGLEVKYWVARRKAKKAAIIADDEAWAEAKAAQLRSSLADVDDDARADGARGRKRARADAPRRTLRAKARQRQRRAARDAQCFAADDAENTWPAEWAPAPKLAPAQPKAKPPPPPWARIPGQTLASALCGSEPRGPAVADVFGAGVMLSIAAAHDLQAMMCGQGRARLFGGAARLDERPSGRAKALAHLDKGGGQRAGGKARAGGAAPQLRAPAARNGGAGKRRC